MKVKLKDIVNRVNGNIDRFNTDLEYYIGKGHGECGEIGIKQHGNLKKDVETLGFKFHFAFEPGDTLFFSRSFALRKAGMAMFKGLCSDSTYILRTKDENILLGEYLPVIVQTDLFWEYCETHHTGGVNFLINWSTLADYEFDLPPLDEQRVLADKLWAAYRLKEAYRRLLAATQEIVKSQFIEMFPFKENPYNWPILSFCQFASIDATMTSDFETYADYPHIGIDSIEQDTGRLIGYRTVRADNVKSGKYIFTGNHIIYSKIRPNLNKVATPDFTGLCSADSYPILPNTELMSKNFLAYLLRSETFLEYIIPLSNRTGMPKVNRDQVEGFSIPGPPLPLQEQFVEIAEQADKSGFELRKSIDAIDNVIKSLINNPTE